MTTIANDILDTQGIFGSNSIMKMPRAQTITDKKNYIESKKKAIAKNKKILLEEIKESDFTKTDIKEIEKIFKPENHGTITKKEEDKNKEDMNKLLKTLSKSQHLSKRGRRVATIILESQENIERAYEHIAIFNNHYRSLEQKMYLTRQ